MTLLSIQGSGNDRAMSTFEAATRRDVSVACHPERNAVKSRDQGGKGATYGGGTGALRSLDSTALRSG